MLAFGYTKSKNTNIFKSDETNSYYIIFEVIVCKKGLLTVLFVKILNEKFDGKYTCKRVWRTVPQNTQ